MIKRAAARAGRGMAAVHGCGVLFSGHSAGHSIQLIYFSTAQQHSKAEQPEQLRIA